MNCTVLAGSELKPVQGKVAIGDGEIQAVGVDVRAEQDDAVYDLKGATVMPGLIDSHCHLIYRDVVEPYDIELRKSLPEATIDAVFNAQVLLQKGFTTVRDVGSRGNIGVEIGNAISNGGIPGARVRAAAQIISAPGGLGDFHPSHIFEDHPYRYGLAAQIVGPHEARALVRRQLKDGADWIKVGVSGTGFNPLCPAERNGLSDIECRAVIEEAHQQSIPVAAHAESAHAVRVAASNGAETIEHGIYIDDVSLESMIEHGVTLSPTLAMYRAFAIRGQSMGIPMSIVDGHKRTHEHHTESVRRAFHAGIRIVAGGDAGLRHFPQGSCVEEVAAYVELIGMTPQQALQTLTINPARLLCIDKEVGSVDAGKKADLLVLTDNPLLDVTVLQRTESRVFVMQSGAVVDGRLPLCGSVPPVG